MASVRHEIVIDAAPDHVWDVLRDVGAVHERLLPGRVAGSRVEGGQRFLTFPDGHVIRELIVAIDDDARRLAYSVVEGRAAVGRLPPRLVRGPPGGQSGESADLDH
jgi:Polyketide cyclase / dehydrase and lipid transport